MKLKYEVVGHKQLSRNLRLFVGKMENLSDFFREGIDIIESRTDDVFASQGANVEKAGRWPALADSTLKARKNRWGYYKKTPNNPGILRWTGNLQTKRAKNISDAFGELTFGAPYGIYHQKGGGKLPQRVVIDLSNTTNELIVKALQSKVQREMGIFGRQA